MRTTVTLDDELFHRLREEAARSRRRFGDVLNERLRLGFLSGGSPKSRRAKFKVEPFPKGGFAPGVDERKLNQLLDTLEIDERKR